MSRRDFSHANNPDFDCASNVILLPFGRRSYLEALVDTYSGEAVPLDETTDRIVYQLGGLTLVYSGMGGPAAANALEMIRNNGGRRVVIFGACGGTDPKVAVGDLVVVSGAVRGEGTSRYYAPMEFPAAFDPVLTTRLHEAAGRADTGNQLGVVYTTDAGYRQGPEIYETYAGLVIAVAFHLCIYRSASISPWHCFAFAFCIFETACLAVCANSKELRNPEDRGQN